MGKFSEYNVPLKSLSPGEHTYNFHIGEQFFANMENTDIHGADLNVKLTVTFRAERYALHFEVAGTVTVLCDRCLDDLVYPVEAEYDVMVEYGDDYNCDSDDLLIIPWCDRELNVAYTIYDTIVLAIPMKRVHPLGKCNRQMSAQLRKYRSQPDDEDAELENELIDEIDELDPQ